MSVSTLSVMSQEKISEQLWHLKLSYCPIDFKGYVLYLKKKKEKNKLLKKQCLNFISDLFWVMGILNPPPTLISNEYHMSTSI